MARRNKFGRVRVALVYGACALFSSPVFGYVTQEPLSFWPVGNVEWQLNLLPDGGNIPNPPLQDGSTSWDDAFHVAVDAWNAIIPDAVLTLSAVKSSGVTPDTGNSVNNVGFSDTVFGTAWGSNTLGISMSTWSGNKRIENDILFNSTKKWDAYTGPLQSSGGQMIGEIRRVALHEMGHSLGLNHPDQDGQVVDAIMNSMSSNIDALVQDDIDGMVFIYGAIMPLAITQHPQSVSVPAGASASFNVKVTGSEEISYAWERSTNGGATFSTFGPAFTGFSFTTVSMSSNGHQFRAVVTNSAGSVTSEVATLTVTTGAEAPAFASEPHDATADAGDDAVFTVAVTGSPTPTLQWQISDDGGATFENLADGASTSGATTSSLTLGSVAESFDGRRVRCVASNSAGTVNSAVATLTVNVVTEAPAFTTGPQDATMDAGDDAVFTVAVTGSPTPTLQWQISDDGGATFENLADGASVDGVTTPSLTLGSVAESFDGRRVRCVASNSAGTVNSAAAMLTVNVVTEAPGFTLQPQAESVSAGESVQFAVAVTGDPAPTLQWQVSTDGGSVWNDIFGQDVTYSGSTSTTLGIGAAEASMDGDQFRALATNVAGTATSNTAALSVAADPPPPAPIAAPAEMTGATDFSASWQPSTGATGYRVDLALDGDFTDFDAPFALNDVDVGNVTSLDFSDLPTGTYHLRVRAYSDSAIGADSNPITIVVNGGRMANLSTRGQTSAGDAGMIAGFVVGGAQPKQLLIRAVGPTLAAAPFGLSGTVPNPRLRLQKIVDGAVAEETVHDDWNASDTALTNATATVGAFDLASGSLDAAALVTLEPGSYTAQVETVTDEAGIAIVEVYETDTTARLANISTRGFVGVGSSIIIPGTVVGDGWKRLLVRAVGETLGKPPFAVPGVLGDPILEVYSSSSPGAPPLFTNDDWGGDDGFTASVSESVGAFALGEGSTDAALVVDLQPGGYTFQVRGKDGATGVVIVEIYEAP